MPTPIQAYNRTKKYTTNIVALSAVIEFAPNAFGDVVADVESEAAVDWLLRTPTAFRLYQAPADAPVVPIKVVRLPPGDEQYLLKSGDGTAFDLRPLNDEQLHEFCKANNIVVHPNAKGNTIRDKIVAALKVEA